MTKFALPIAALTCVAPFAYSTDPEFSTQDRPCPPTRFASPPSVLRAETYGAAVATNGRFWFVGEPFASMPGCGGAPLGCRAGAVHVYEMVDGQLEFYQTLMPDVLTFLDMFGISLDADGDRLVVGSYYTDWPTTTGSGGGYIFEFDGDSWNQVAELVPPPEFRGDGGGTGVSIQGEVALVNPGFASWQDVYLYREGAEGWELNQVIEPPIPLTSDDKFGHSAVVGGEWLAVSAYQDDARVSRGGSVFIFRRDADGLYQFTQRILPVEPFEDTREFGFAVTIDGDTLAISAGRAERDVEDQGAIFMYELEGDEWVFKQEVTHADPVKRDKLGRGMGLHGDTLLAHIDRTLGGASEGLLRFQRGADGLWREVGPLIPTPVQYAGGYGFAIAMNGPYALVGAKDERAVPGVQEFPGAAYLFDLSCGVCEPDLDADGALTIFDFLSFANLFQDGDLTADFDGDGELTVFDFLAFQTAFDAGCP